MLHRAYKKQKADIEKRLGEFRSVLDKRDEDIFAELVFCILTPQSRARNCERAVKRLVETGYMLKGDAKYVAGQLRGGVRFHNTKAKHIVKARELLKNGLKSKLIGDPTDVREWFVGNVYGLGYKEASHFLRNIGLGENLAILDRHILKNLAAHGAIKEVPKSLTKKRYMEIEDKMKAFAQSLGIPAAHLDLLFWSQETGEIFK